MQGFYFARPGFETAARSADIPWSVKRQFAGPYTTPLPALPRCHQSWSPPQSHSVGGATVHVTRYLNREPHGGRISLPCGSSLSQRRLRSLPSARPGRRATLGSCLGRNARSPNPNSTLLRRGAASLVGRARRGLFLRCRAGNDSSPRCWARCGPLLLRQHRRDARERQEQYACRDRLDRHGGSPWLFIGRRDVGVASVARVDGPAKRPPWRLDGLAR